MDVRPEEAFRKHRHDVMNQLQLVKAYIQLGNPEAAADAVQRIAEWYQSLSFVQNEFSATNAHVLWTAAQCPRLRVVSIDEEISTDPRLIQQMSDAMLWCDEEMSLAGVKFVKVKFGFDTDGSSKRICVVLQNTEEIRDWWNHRNDESAMPSDVTFRIVLDASL